MNKLEFSLCGGIGDNLLVRVFFDTIKHNYSQINVSHDRNVVNFWRNDSIQYCGFLDEMGKSIFSEPPYRFDKVQRPLADLETMSRLINRLGIIPQKPDIDHLLCKGTSLGLGEEYIVITTKVRFIPKKQFYPLSPSFWNTINELSKKYKIVIMGEKVVEISKEYSVDGNVDSTFSIYEQVIANVPSDRIIDLTVPALGITTPNFKKIQQDCLIMKEAKFVITLGIGGNLWLALSVANTIGFRSTHESLGTFSIIMDKIHNPTFNTAFLTKDWNIFIQRLVSL